jgi:tripartite-type tricarboxylate transporter receptor subunit TctC
MRESMGRLTRRRLGAGLLAAGASFAAAVPLRRAAAQEAFPNRPIRIVVPFPAGGTTDLLARLYAQRLTETLGQSVVVENRGGGGGSIGADVVAKAAPDGYTLLFHNLTFCTTTAALEHLGRAPHSIERDFAPISMGANVPMMLLVNPAVPAQDLREFVAHAKGRTDLFYGSTGPGSTVNLVGEILKRDAGIRMDHIPFRGAAPLVQDLLAGRIQFGGDQLSSSLGHIRAGALRPVATLAARRAGALPEVPTAREQGFPNIELLGWNGFLAPARTPEPVLARLHREIAAAARHPEVARRIAELGAEPGGDSPEAFGAAIRAQLAQVRPLVAELRMQVE